MTTVLEEVFFNTDLIGYIGPFAVVVICAFIINKKKDLALVCFVFEILLLAQYFPLLDATPDYIWHIFLILFGGVIPSLISGLKR